MVFGAIGALAALTGFSTIYSHSELEKLSRQVHDDRVHNVKLVNALATRIKMTNEAVDVLKNVSTTMLRVMKANAEAMDTKTVVSDMMMGSVVLSQEVDRILDGLEALSRHRLSPHLILPGQMAEALSALREGMSRNGYELAIDNVFQLFQLDTSHLYYGNQTIEIIVHIPAFKPNNIMTLYKHRNMPVRFDGIDGVGREGSPLYLQPQSQDVYLAVDVSEFAFQTFT